MQRLLTKVPQARRTLAFGSATHVWSDLFFALFVPLLPLIMADRELELSFTQVGLLRSAYTGASAVLQVPAGLVAERLGEFWLLVGGNMWVAAGLVGMAAAPTYLFLLAATIVGGLGGGSQHPLASSMVSRAYEEHGRSAAVGTVNFAGDLGKMAAPAIALGMAADYGWRATMRLVGLVGLGFMGLSLFVRRAVDTGKPGRQPESADAGSQGESLMGGFMVLSGVGFLDSATRGAALTFLPFIMQDKGLGTEEIFGMLILLLAGGAAGKFVCGWLSDRYGAVRLIWGTKGLTALLLLAVLATPPLALGPLMVAIGIGLNGTSSVLYASVATFVRPHRRARLYGLFYTTNEGGSVVAPVIFGRIADLLSLRAAMVAMSMMTLSILLVSLALRKHLAEARARAVG